MIDSWIGLIVFGVIVFGAMIFVFSFLIAVFFRWLDERSDYLHRLEEDDDRPEYNL